MTPTAANPFTYQDVLTIMAGISGFATAIFALVVAVKKSKPEARKMDGETNQLSTQALDQATKTSILLSDRLIELERRGIADRDRISVLEGAEMENKTCQERLSGLETKNAALEAAVAIIPGLETRVKWLEEQNHRLENWAVRLSDQLTAARIVPEKIDPL